MDNKAKRYNTGKLRYDLLPPFALEQVVEVYSRGAHKYTVYEDDQGNVVSGKDVPFDLAPKKVIDDGSDNWKKGLSWKSAMASVKRHIAAWEKGEDIDQDETMKTLHLANAAWGLLTLLEYYKIHPQGDDRDLKKMPKIGLDIDGVIADFVPHYLKYFKLDKTLPNHWNDPRFRNEKYWTSLANNKSFYLNIPILTPSSELLFEPACYVSARSIPKEWTQEWLDMNLYPKVPLYQIKHNESKVEVIKKANIDIFIDDNYANFEELNANGINCFLMSQSHNLKYKVGYKRINSPNDIMKWI